MKRPLASVDLRNHSLYRIVATVAVLMVFAGMTVWPAFAGAGVPPAQVETATLDMIATDGACCGEPAGDHAPEQFEQCPSPGCCPHCPAVAAIFGQVIRAKFDSLHYFAYSRSPTPGVSAVLLRPPRV